MALGLLKRILAFPEDQLKKSIEEDEESMMMLLSVEEETKYRKCWSLVPLAILADS